MQSIIDKLRANMTAEELAELDTELLAQGYAELPTMEVEEISPIVALDRGWITDRELIAWMWRAQS